MDALAAAAAAAAADPDIAANHVRPDHRFDLVDAETRTVMQNRGTRVCAPNTSRRT